MPCVAFNYPCEELRVGVALNQCSSDVTEVSGSFATRQVHRGVGRGGGEAVGAQAPHF